MLKSVRLKNFKLHEDTSIDCAPITVFIGPNNSGKSSIFQALLALRQAATQGPPNNFVLLQPARRRPTTEEDPFLYSRDQLLDFGDFMDVVRQGHNEVEVAATGVVNSPKPLGDLGPIEVTLNISIRDNQLSGHAGTLRFGEGQLQWGYLSGPGQSMFPQPHVRVGNSVLKFVTVAQFQLILPAAHDFPPNSAPDFLKRLADTGQSLAGSPVELIRSVHPVYPLRGFEEWGSPQPMYPARDMDRLALADRSVALTSVLASDRKLRNQVSERLQELVGIGIDIETAGINRVKIFAKPVGAGGPETPFANEGTGTNQLPFILVPVALAPRHETVLLSEPEAHLHPKAQSELTALLLTVAKKQNLQFFIETHSEHVLHRLLHAIGKGELTKEELALYYFVNEDGRANVKRLAINDLGQVEGGLPGFFEQSLTELTEYLDALRKP